MDLHVVASFNCSGKSCPTLYTTDRNTVVVQGDIANHHIAGLPGHEGAVELPLDFFRDAVKKLS